jgi:hypothetical protein
MQEALLALWMIVCGRSGTKCARDGALEGQRKSKQLKEGDW